MLSSLTSLRALALFAILSMYYSVQAQITINGSILHDDPSTISADATITLSPSGGSGTYTYNWSGPSSFTSTSSTINGLASGIYSVTVTDANNTTLTATDDLTVQYQTQWRNMVNCTTSGQAIYKNSGSVYSWYGGAFSYNRLAANTDGKVTYTVVSTGNSMQFRFGLSKFDVDVYQSSQNYSIYQYQDEISFYFNDQNVGSVVTVSVGDVLEISREGNSLKWYVNGSVQHTETVDATEVLFTDLSIRDDYYNQLIVISSDFTTPFSANASIIHCEPNTFNSGSISLDVQGGTGSYSYSWSGPNSFSSSTANITNLEHGTYNLTVTDNGNSSTITRSYDVFYQIDWVNEVDVTTTGSTFTRNSGGTYYNKGASSGNVIRADQDGSVSFQVANDDHRIFVGLSEIDLDANNSSIKYGLFLNNNGEFWAVKNGVGVTNLNSPYRSGDIFRIERVSTSINIIKNGTTLHSFTVDDSEELYLDISASYNQTLYNIFADFGYDFAAYPAIVHCDIDDPATGSINLNVKGGTSPYTYNWSGGLSSNATQSAIEPGTYTVTITDNSSQTTSATIEVGYKMTWQNDVYTNGYDHYVQKIGGGNSSNSYSGGNSSVNRIEANQNGYFSFMLDNISSSYAVGVSDKDFDNKLNSINYAFIVIGDEYFIKHNNGTALASGNFNMGDEFRIERTGTDLKFSLDGTVLYTFTVDANKDLLLDNSIKLENSSIDNIHTNAGIPFNAYPTITHCSPQQVADGSIVLNVAGGKAPYTYNWSGPDNFTSSSADIYNLAAGSYSVTITDNTSGTPLQKVNEYEVGHKLAWANTANVTTGDHQIYKIGGGTIAFSAGGSSLNRLQANADGYMQFEIMNLGADFTYVGLSRGFTHISSSDMNYGFALNTTTYTFVTNSGIVGTPIDYNVGDVFRIERSGSNLYYKVNGTTVNTVTVDPTEELFFDVSYRSVIENVTNFTTDFYVPFTGDPTYVYDDPSNTGSGSITLNTVGGESPYTYQWDDASTSSTRTGLSAGIYSVTITDANNQVVEESYEMLTDINWQNTANITLGNGTVEKTSGTSWNGGGSSTRTFAANENGYVAFRYNSRNGNIAVGLSEADPNVTVASIDYAIYIDNNNLYTIESGSTNSFGTANVGDWFRVERIGSNIIYLRNGEEFRRITVDPLEVLMLDMSVATTAGYPYFLRMNNTSNSIEFNNVYLGTTQSNFTVCSMDAFRLTVEGTCTGAGCSTNFLPGTGTISIVLTFDDDDLAQSFTWDPNTLDTDITITRGTPNPFNVKVDIAIDENEDFYAFDYTINGCLLIPENSSNNFVEFTLPIEWPNNATLQSYDQTLATSPTNVSLNLDYPFLQELTRSVPHTTQNISPGVATPGNDYEFIMAYENLRSLPFTGSIIMTGDISGNPNCENIYGNEAYGDGNHGVVFYDGATDQPLGTFPNVDFSNPFSLSSNGISLGLNDYFIVFKRVEYLECFVQDNNSSTSCKTTVNLSWGCDNNNTCLTMDQFSLEMGTNIIPPDIVINRIYPTSNDVWDASCSGTETEWAFLVYNNGGSISENVEVVLNGNLDRSLTMIDYTSIQIHMPGSATFDPSTIQNYNQYKTVNPNEIGTPDLIPSSWVSNGQTGEYELPANYAGITPLTSSEVLSLTSACATNALETLRLGSDEANPVSNIGNITLGINDGFIITFRTQRCCEVDSTILDYEVFGPDGVNYNRWNISATGDHECHTYTDLNGRLENREESVGVLPPNITDKYPVNEWQTLEGVSASKVTAISTNMINAAGSDLSMNQETNSANKSIVGLNNSCPTGFKHDLFVIDNTGFMETSSVEDMQLFCADLACTTPSGVIKVSIDLPGNMAINTNLDPIMYSTTSLREWHGEWDNSHPVAKFVISDASKWVSPNSIPTGEDLVEFMGNSQIEFELGVCCPNDQSPGSVGVKTSFVPMTDGTLTVSATNPDLNPCPDEDLSCALPLSYTGFMVTTLCPGCVTPGLIVDPYLNAGDTPYKLERKTLGFADIDNDGIAETTTGANGPEPLPIDLDNYTLPSPRNKVKLERSIVGDILSMEYKADMYGGSSDPGEGGFSLEQWNTAHPNNPPRYLIFQQTIDNADVVGFTQVDPNNKFLFTYTDMTPYIPGTNDVPNNPNFSEEEIEPIFIDDNGFDPEKPTATVYSYVFDLEDLTDFDASYIQGSDIFKIQADFKICSNPDSRYFSEVPLDPVAVLGLSPINTADFPAGTPLGDIFLTPPMLQLSYLPEYYSGNTTHNDPNNIPPAIPDTDMAGMDPSGVNNIVERTYWVCSSPNANHTVYPIEVTVNEKHFYDNRTHDNAEPSCVKPGQIEIEYKIISNNNNQVFDFEVRPIPNLEWFDGNGAFDFDILKTGPQPSMGFQLLVPIDYEAEVTQLYTKANEDDQNTDYDYFWSVVLPDDQTLPINNTYTSAPGYTYNLFTELNTISNAYYSIPLEDAQGTLYYDIAPLDVATTATNYEQLITDDNDKPVLLMGDESLVMGIHYQLNYSACSATSSYPNGVATIQQHEYIAIAPELSSLCDAGGAVSSRVLSNHTVASALTKPTADRFTRIEQLRDNNGRYVVSYAGNQVTYTVQIIADMEIANIIAYFYDNDLLNDMTFVGAKLGNSTINSKPGNDGSDYTVIDIGDILGTQNTTKKPKLQLTFEYTGCDDLFTYNERSKYMLPLYFDWNCDDVYDDPVDPATAAKNDCSTLESIELYTAPYPYHPATESEITYTDLSTNNDLTSIERCTNDERRLSVTLRNLTRGGIGNVKANFFIPLGMEVVEGDIWNHLNPNANPNNPSTYRVTAEVFRLSIPGNDFRNNGSQQGCTADFNMFARSDVSVGGIVIGHKYSLDLTKTIDIMNTVVYDPPSDFRCYAQYGGQKDQLGSPKALASSMFPAQGMSTEPWGPHGDRDRYLGNELVIDFDVRITACDDITTPPTYQFSYNRYCDISTNGELYFPTSPTAFAGTEGGFFIVENNCVDIDIDDLEANDFCDPASFTPFPKVDVTPHVNAKPDVVYTWSYVDVSSTSNNVITNSPTSLSIDATTQVEFDPGNYSISPSTGDQLILTVTDGSNCETGPYVMTLGALTIDAFATVDPGCGSGTLSLNLPDNTATGYTYSWSNTNNPGVEISNLHTVTGVAAGTYNIEVSSNGASPACVASATVELSLSPPTVSVAVQDVSCTDAELGSITVTATGNGPFTYTFTNVTTTPHEIIAENVLNPTVSDLEPGDYQVEVTDVNGCTTGNSQTITISETNEIFLDLVAINPTCIGSVDGELTAFIVDADINGDPIANAWNYDYTWAPTASIGASNDENIIGLDDNISYTVSVSIAGTDVCSKTESHTLTDPAPITVTGTPSSPTCFGGTDGAIAISVTGGVPGRTYSYVYSASSTNSGGPHVALNNLESGNYDVTVYDNEGCEFDDNYNWTINDPQVTISNVGVVVDDVTCFNGENGSITVTATGSGTLSYSLDPGPNNQIGNVFNDLRQGSYTIRIDDYININDNDCYIISADVDGPNSAISINPTITPPTCHGGSDGSIDLSGSGTTGGTPGYGYTWDPNQTSQTGPTITGLTSGWYYVTITDGAVCTEAASIWVGDPPIVMSPIPDAQVVNPSCSTATDGTITVLPHHSSNQYSIDGVNYQTSNVFNDLGAGNYTIHIDNGVSCTIIQKTVNDPDDLFISSITSGCGTVEVIAYGGEPPYEFQLYNLEHQYGNLTGSFTGIASGTYTVVVKDLDNCIVTSTATTNDGYPLSMGSADKDAPDHITVDQLGNVYTSGSFSNTVDFGGTSLTVTGNTYDAYLAKYNECGDLLWIKHIYDDGTSNVFVSPVDIEIDATGNNIYIAGAYQGDLVIHDPGSNVTTTITNNSAISNLLEQGFIAKISSSGTIDWVRCMTTSATNAYVKPRDIKLNSTGDIIVTGNFSTKTGSASFWNEDITSTFTGLTLSSSSNSGLFLAKYNSSGAVQWRYDHDDATHYRVPLALELNSYNEIYISMISEDQANSLFRYELQKFDAAGANSIVTKSTSYTANSSFYQAPLAIDINNNVNDVYWAVGLNTGTTTLDGTTFSSNSSFIAKYNSALSTQTWTHQISGGTVKIYDIILDPNNDPVFTGSYGGTISFNGNSHTSNADNDLILAKLENGTSPLVSEDWIIAQGNSTAEIGFGVCYDLYNDLFYWTGAYNGTLNFGSSVTSNGYYDIFIARVEEYGGIGQFLKDRPLDVEQQDNDLLSAASDISLSLYPNPNNGTFTIELRELLGEEDVEVSAYNAVGQQMGSQTYQVEHNGLINYTRLQNESSGIYLIKVTIGNRSFIERVIKQD